MNREAAIAPYSSLCYRFCTSFEPKPQEIVMALFTKEESLAYHEEPRPGKLEVLPVKPCFTQKDLSMAYSPGVANACLAIADDPSLANAYTGRGNLVAVVSNGTAVLGLGNIGPLAGKPVMEGKSVLFKAFADVNAYDINLALTDPDKIIEVVKALEPTFGGINLEDIKAPECFYIEEVLKKEMNIPVFHDDQHGTAIISGAGLINALEITGKKAEDFIVVVSGAGAAAIACAKFYTELGIDPANIRMFDSKGILHKGRTDLNKYKAQFALSEDMTMTEALKGADLFLGLSKKDLLTPDMIKGMADHPVIFACANPDPEIAYPGDGNPPRLHHGYGPHRLPEPDQQPLRLPLHFPRGTGRVRHGNQRGHEACRRPRPRRAGQGAGARRSFRRLSGPDLQLRGTSSRSPLIPASSNGCPRLSRRPRWTPASPASPLRTWTPTRPASASASRRRRAAPTR